MKHYSKVKPLLSYFLKQMENYNEIPFNKKIDPYGFSVGFVFKEVCEDFNLNIIPGIEKCLSGGEDQIKGKNFKGFTKFLFKRGHRIGVPMSEEYSENNFFALSTIRDELYRIMKKMEAFDPEVSEASKDKLFLKQKSLNKDLGGLNAIEWFELAQFNLELFKSTKEVLDKKLSQ